jgi:drug/metabolite transporter (DMT)-like permease
LTTEVSKTVVLTLLALVAFASNSLLTRLALGSHEIDAASFTAIRLGAGALVLSLVVRARTGAWASGRGGAGGALMLFAYAAPFSFAYVRIGAAVGALVLFGVVQLTMIGYGLVRGERPPALTWLGLALAAAGLFTLTVPAVARPDPLGVALMTVAGVAWGAYSLLGRTKTDPLATNAQSFVWSTVPALGLGFALSRSSVASGRGIVLALLCGGITSGLGYAIWYRAVPRLSVTQAAVAQLSVPVLAALGATAFLGERLSLRVVACGTAVLLGVGLALSERLRQPLDRR